MTESQTFALALEQIDGVGRVTAGRLLKHFATYEELLRYPREQVLTRIKGAPNAEALVGRLFDRAAMEERLASAREAIGALGKRGVTVLTARDEGWPAGVDDLPRGQRPVLLYVYGYARLLEHPLVAFFARPPLAEGPFERAQELVRHLASEGVGAATGAATGFDVVVHKLTAAGPTPQPSLLVAPTGMGRLPSKMRPSVALAVRAGGAFLSPFPMEHGPFEHDDRERALVQAALAAASVFVDPRPETAEWDALTWSLEAGRPTFALSDDPTPLPDRVHVVREQTDFDWVLAASVGTRGRPDAETR